jgi:Spy/CpxP family protein refolding chaperone
MPESVGAPGGPLDSRSNSSNLWGGETGDKIEDTTVPATPFTLSLGFEARSFNRRPLMRSGDSKYFAAALVLSLSLSLTISTAQAQGPPGMPFPPGGMMGGPSLATQEAVQEDLGLTEKQKAQLKKLEAAMIQRSQATFEEARNGGLEPEEMRDAMGMINREYNTAVAKVFDKNQKARLAQIELQREGLLAVAKTEIASKLKVTSAQTKKVKAIVTEMRQNQFRSMSPPPGAGGPPGAPANDQAKAAPKGKRPSTRGVRPAPDGNAAPPTGDMPPEGGGGFFGGFPEGRPDFNSEEFQAQMAKMMENEKKLRDAASAKIGEVLTKDQTEAFDKLLGKPFDFSKLKFGPPEAAPAEEAKPKTDEATPKKQAPAKSQPKSKSR